MVASVVMAVTVVQAWREMLVLALDRLERTVLPEERAATAVQAATEVLFQAMGAMAAWRATAAPVAMAVPVQMALAVSILEKQGVTQVREAMVVTVDPGDLEVSGESPQELALLVITASMETVARAVWVPMEARAVMVPQAIH